MSRHWSHNASLISRHARITGETAWWWLDDDLERHITEVNGRFWVAADDGGVWHFDLGMIEGPFDTLDEAKAYYLITQGVTP